MEHKLSDPVPIWITGTGTLTCAGISPETLWKNSFENRSGISGGLGRVSDSILSEIRESPLPSRFRPQLESLIHSLPESKPVLLAFYALIQSIQQAGWSDLREDDGII